MVSASKAKRLAKKAAAGSTSSTSSSSSSSSSSSKSSTMDELTKSTSKLSMSHANPMDEDALAQELEIHKAMTCTGVLSSLPTSRDVRIENFTLSSLGKLLITETSLELTFGRRYGLLGANGCGKSTFLKALAARQVPIPNHIDIYLLNEPAPKTNMTALNFVLEEARKELQRLEDLADDLLANEGPESSLLQDIYDRMDALDPATFEARVASILWGLGFDAPKMTTLTQDMSGGWRMRVALAKALFVRPTLLLLDDPTAHLDLGACVWLENYLQKYDRILVLVSHSQDFLNGVCTNMIDLRKQKLWYYGGNYDTYVKTRTEQEVNQMKQYNKQQEEIASIKQFIASCGTYANLVKQAKSRQKILDKMEENLIEKVVPDRIFTFRFPDMPKLPPPVLAFDDVCFSYSGQLHDALYLHLDLGVDMDSRIALVGPNGVGKSTLLRLMLGTLQPMGGRIQRHTGLKMGLYSQHSAEQLALDVSAIEFMKSRFSAVSQDDQYWRGQLGRYGLTKEAQTCAIGTLSEGQKSRIVFALLALESPNLLLLDEPTNGLDIPTIDSLAEAINAYSGGVVVVSHDFRLLDKVAKDILVCENRNVRRWDDDILAYKKYLAKQMEAHEKQRNSTNKRS